MLIGQAGWYDSIGHPPSGTVIASCPALINDSCCQSKNLVTGQGNQFTRVLFKD